jgi:hypothetical protein
MYSPPKVVAADHQRAWEPGSLGAQLEKAAPATDFIGRALPPQPVESVRPDGSDDPPNARVMDRPCPSTPGRIE